MFNKSGGSAGPNGVNWRLQLPKAVIEALKVTPDDRGVILDIKDGEVIIKKDHSSDD